MKLVVFVLCLALSLSVPLSMASRKHEMRSFAGPAVGPAAGPVAGPVAGPTAGPVATTPPTQLSNQMPKIATATCAAFFTCTTCVGLYGCAWQSAKCTDYGSSKDDVARAISADSCDGVIDNATITKTIPSFVPPDNGCNCGNSPTIAYATDVTPIPCSCAHSLLEVRASHTVLRDESVMGLLASIGDKEGMEEEKRMAAVRLATASLMDDASTRLDGVSLSSAFSMATEADTPQVDFNNFDVSTLKSLNW